MNRILWGIIHVILLTLASHKTIAHEASARDKNTYIIGVGKSDLFPYFGHCNGEFCGLSRDLLDNFAQEAGVKFQYEITPVIRVQEQLKLGHIDGFFPDNPKWLARAPERAELHFSKPAIKYAEGMLVLEQQVPTNALTTYGVLYKWELPEFTGRILTSDAIPLYTETTPALIGLILKGRVNAIYGNYGVAMHDLEKMGMNAKTLVPHPAIPLDIDNYYMSALQGSALLNMFNDWLKKTIKEISNYSPAVPGMANGISLEYSEATSNYIEH